MASTHAILFYHGVRWMFGPEHIDKALIFVMGKRESLTFILKLG